MKLSWQEGMAIAERVASDVTKERQRQWELEGFTFAHDDEHKSGEIAQAAACYLLNTVPHPRNGGSSLYDKIRIVFGVIWPWDFRWWKPRDVREDLVRAAALVLAEIERIDRAAAEEQKQ